MRFPLTGAVLPRVIWLDTTSSTNAALRELVTREGDRVPHGTLVITAAQTEGRGRAGRGWITPPGTALAASVLLRPTGSALAPSWVPLIAGSAVTRALQPLFGPGLRVGVKWPNDVHVRDESEAVAGRPGQKLCGILSEMLPDGSIIVGMGINLLIPEWELPTERATSVLAAGGEVGAAERIDETDAAGIELADRVLSELGSQLLVLAARSVSDPESVTRQVRRDSLTLGTEVRVHLPGGEVVDGLATSLDENGALVVDRPTLGRLIVSAADVEHLR